MKKKESRAPRVVVVIIVLVVTYSSLTSWIENRGDAKYDEFYRACLEFNGFDMQASQKMRTEYLMSLDMEKVLESVNEDEMARAVISGDDEALYVASGGFMLPDTKTESYCGDLISYILKQ